VDKKRTIKEQICKHLQELLDNKINVAQNAIESVRESRDSDTKSSVGDKYETGRAMMHIEVEKHEFQLIKTLKLKNDLSKIDIQKAYKKVEYGSLIKTNHGNYFISIGIGKLEIDNEVFYAISLNSPVGMQLKDKKAGDIVHFRENEISIIEIN
jgi:transcription elongation GreA/GreB family factor